MNQQLGKRDSRRHWGRQLLLSLGLGALMLAAACSGGGGGGEEEPMMPVVPKTPAAIISSYSGSASMPTYSLGNEKGDRVDVFGSTAANGDFLPSQAVLKPQPGSGNGQGYRVLFDKDGRMARLNNEATGEFLVVETMDGGNKYMHYDAAGKFLGGFALVQDAAGKYWVAAVEGAPVFAGQIQGQLNNGSVGSFAVVAKPASGLGPMQPLPASLQSYLDAGQKTGASRQSQTISSGLAQLVNGGASGYLIAGAVVGGLVFGGAAVPAAVVAAQVALIGFGLSVVAQTVKSGLQNGRNDIPEGEGRDMYDSLFGTSSEELSSRSFIDNAAAQVQSIVNNGRARLDRIFNTVSRAGDAVRDTLSSTVDAASQPQPTSTPPPIGADLDGFGVDSDSQQYPLTGRIEANGQVQLNGRTADSSRMLQINGTLDSGSKNLNGSYTGTVGNGTVTGSSEEIGSCQSRQASGGEGTFSYALDVGAARGAVDFTYQAFSIPDAFSLFNGGSQVFSTGGLVSGSSSSQFSVSNRTVFVNVSAPNSGTAWEFTLSCAS